MVVRPVCSQDWQDPGVFSTLNLGERDRVLCLESAGERAFALLLAGAASVVVLSASREQLALVALKVAAMQVLPVQSVRSLLGVGHFGRRVWFYHYVRERLSPEMRQFWDGREDWIREGLLDCGQLEQFFVGFRARMKSWLRPQDLDALLHARPDQRAALARRWMGLRWRALCAAARPPDARAAGVFAQVQRSFYEDPSYFHHWLLTGQFPDPERAHAYLSAEGHRQLVPLLDRLSWVCADSAEGLGDFQWIDGGDRPPHGQARQVYWSWEPKPGARRDRSAWYAGVVTGGPGQ